MKNEILLTLIGLSSVSCSTSLRNEKETNPNVIFIYADDLNEVYLAEVFKKAGYFTGEIGKLDWGFATTHKQMKRHGWDYYYGYLDHVRRHGFYPPFLFEDGRMVAIEGNTRADCGKSMEAENPIAYNDRWNMEGKNQAGDNLLPPGKRLRLSINHGRYVKC